jgi:hypothetical protein
MYRYLISLAATVAAAAALLTGPGAAAGSRPAAGAGPASGTWGRAQEVPGTGAHNAGGLARADAVSCTAPGDCVAGGSYSPTSRTGQPYVASQAKGTWQTAQKILGPTGGAAIGSVSCPAPGDCSAVSYGTYAVGETNGIWGKAIQVPGLAALNQGNSAAFTEVSCASPGNCGAGGFYSDSAGNNQAFVVSQTHGTWGTAEEVPGTAALNKLGFAQVDSVSCASAGNCSAAGFYAVKKREQAGFVVNETHGTWGTAQVLHISAGTDPVIGWVSCTSAGNCAGGGGYLDRSGAVQAFVATETGGIWGNAEEVPGIAALNQGHSAIISSLSCPAAGNCGAGGSYTDSAGKYQVFVVSETNGTWGTAEQVPGTAALNRGKFPLAEFNTVSCASVGNCSAGGLYTDRAEKYQAFVVGETNGTWGDAQTVPRTAALNTGGGAAVFSVSCTSAAHCSAGGYYSVLHADGIVTQEAFVVTET